MARFNEILVGRFNRLAQKLLSMKGPASLVTLNDELHAVFPFFNGAENRYLESWQRYAVEIDQPAVAANSGTIQFRNPVGSNVIAVFEKLTGTNAGAATDFPAISLVTASTDLATVFTPTSIRLDARGNQNPTLILSRASPGPAIVQTILIAALPVNANYDYIVTDAQEIPLLPGDVLRYNSGIVNQRLICSVIWRERFLEDSERT